MTTTTTKRKIESQPKLKLYYFNIKGKGEPIRLFCAYAGLELDDHRFASRDEFQSLKDSGKIAFGQVPMLQIDDDGKKDQLVQTAAILRYLAKIANVGYPLDDPIHAAKVDAALDQETDAFMGMTVASYTTRFGIPLDDDMKCKSYELINSEVLPRHLGNLEKLLNTTSNTTGWIANTTDGPSIADFAWYVRLVSIENKAELSDEIKTLQNFPSCKAFVTKFGNLDAIKEYYASK